MSPFFTFFGGKWRVALKYPIPNHDTIIEPFAGSAGYSLRYYDRKIHLNDIDPIIFGVWDFLIKSSKQDILKLPIELDHVDDVKSCQEAKWLVGFWLNKGSTGPRLTPSKWMRSKIRPNSHWGEAIRQRIADQIDKIKHWKISNKEYFDIENRNATWFIDPPYKISGKLYRYKNIDYKVCSNWCQNLFGQVTVCEQEGADWLNFKSFIEIKALEGKRGSKKHKEVIWINNNLFEITS